MKLTFLGAAGTVTGSKYLLESQGKRILVDCGLFQGLKELRLRNWNEFPVPPSTLDAVILTHAHIDHSGYLPVLVKQGFRGTVHCTQATKRLCSILLPDSGRLQEEEAEFANRKGFSKHHPALPLYTQQEAERSLRQIRTHAWSEAFSPVAPFEVRFERSGHILGAALVEISDGKRTILFTGDLGRPNDPIMRPPATIRKADYLVLESTYGDREHDPAPPEDELARLVVEAHRLHGVVLIPAFSVGRSQTLLHLLARLKSQSRIPNIPIYLNSPMSIQATEIFLDFQDEHRLSPKECDEFRDIACYVHTAEESKALNQLHGPMVILSANGMATGGRILHHLKAFAPNPNNTILFTGYQAAGTRGASMLAGAPTIKMHGEQIPVRAKVRSLDNLSAHADAGEIMSWLRGFEAPPLKTFVTHGEPAASEALTRRISSELGWSVEAPVDQQSVEFLPERVT